jgi:Na+-translocating ferredoxin:NAD+ oxidoreductase RNF subunit RnfB
MGYPPSEHLEPILRKNFSPEEAEVALGIPNRRIPLQPASVGEIAEALARPAGEVESLLEGLASRGIVFSGTTAEGEKGYALQQVAFGFPQAFFWSGEDTDHARDMAEEIPKFLDLETTRKLYGTENKAFRFVPVKGSVDAKLEAVYPFHVMEHIVEKAGSIAVATCVCRQRAKLLGKECNHLMEVCVKFDELAEYVIDRGMARRIDHEEARAVLKKCRDNDLVHFVDNAVDDVKHNCNCCGCACWSVARIQRRLIPRDVIMATYFLRETEEAECTGCGDCVEPCPVKCLEVVDDTARVETEWCIGCGVCIDKCAAGAARLVLRPDRVDAVPETNFRALHEKIMGERDL